MNCGGKCIVCVLFYVYMIIWVDWFVFFKLVFFGQFDCMIGDYFVDIYVV